MKLEMVQMDQPEIGPDDVLIRVRACGICGSDVHGLDGSTGRRIPPLVMGHEAAGVVERAGANVRDLKAGDRVTFDSTIYCGHCAFCARGDVNLCDNRMVLGVSPGEYRRHGAFAEFVSVPRRIVYRLPDSLSFEQAALIEAASVAVHAVSLTPVRLGDTGVVVGSGMIGVLIVQSLRAAGCANVIVDRSRGVAPANGGRIRRDGRAHVGRGGRPMRMSSSSASGANESCRLRSAACERRHGHTGRQCVAEGRDSRCRLWFRGRSGCKARARRTANIRRSSS